MRAELPAWVERRRVLVGHSYELGSTAEYGMNGAFAIPGKETPTAAFLRVIASDGMGWEHVSVSVFGEDRCPTWEEMEFVCRLFWNTDECVMQLHPPRSEWINQHKYCLHLWKPTTPGVSITRPPKNLVGVVTS